MKRLLAMLLFLLMMILLIPAVPALAASGVEINETNFADETFREYVSKNIDSNQNGYLSTSELGVKQIDIPADYNTICSLKGIEFFYDLEMLRCINVSNLTELDLSQNAELKSLDCSYDYNLSNLNVSGNAKLETLGCINTALTKLDVSHNPALKSLCCGENGSLTELDVSKNPKLERLSVYSTGLTELDVSYNPSLKKLECTNTGIVALDLSNCPLLVETIEKGTLDVSPSAEMWSYYGEGGRRWIYVPEGITLILYHKPVITTQPKSVSAAVGSTAKFTVTATGTASYQWQWRSSSTGEWKDSTASSAKTATLSVTAESYRSGYQYRCKVTNAAGTTTSNAATLTVTSSTAKPTITTQPKSVSAAVGSTAKFTVAASGTGLSYQWQWRSSSTGEWKDSTASSAKTATLSVTAESYRSGYQYRCKVTNSAGTTTSNTATLTVCVKPTVTTQPTSKTAAAGTTVKFTVSAKGGALTYQWQFRSSGSASWSNCSAADAKTASMSVEAKSYRNGYQYRCLVKNVAGEVYTNTVTLTVK